MCTQIPRHAFRQQLKARHGESTMKAKSYVFDSTISSAVPAGDEFVAETAVEPARAVAGRTTVSDELLQRMHRYWMAANYLTVGQIFLRDNPLLREPLRAEHIKPRLLGHWGTSPGLSLLYVHLNRLIVERDASMIYLAGPDTAVRPSSPTCTSRARTRRSIRISRRDSEGMRKLFRQFSTPGGIPSHVSVPTPGSIHEGGELGYVLAHAFGAAFDNPDLIVAAVVGDGEAETAPLEGSWKSISFLNPARDGAVLPILHLNGYKISGPTVFAREGDDDVIRVLEGHGYEIHEVAGDDPIVVHRSLAAVLDRCFDRIRAIQADARARGAANIHERPRWPAIVLRTPKGWTGPAVVGDLPVEGTFRAHQVPLPQARTNPDELAMLERWLRSYQPETLFDEAGRLVSELATLAPRGEKRMGASPHANGGGTPRPLDVPIFQEYAVDVPKPATVMRESTRQLGEMLRDVFVRNAEAGNFRLFCPDETNSNRLSSVFEVENRCLIGRRHVDR